MNLADAPLLPQDDLALAVALKSPLFGLTDDDLFKLAWQRKGSMRQALDHHAATGGKSEAALHRLAPARRACCRRRRLRSMPGCSAATAAAGAF
jgi:ATP-dependent helicase/nuclease subunit A